VIFLTFVPFQLLSVVEMVQQTMESSSWNTTISENTTQMLKFAMYMMDSNTVRLEPPAQLKKLNISK